jgi:hypothetical protein
VPFTGVQVCLTTPKIDRQFLNVREQRNKHGIGVSYWERR